MFLELLTNEDDALESSFHIPLAVCCSVSVASLVVLLAAFFITQESKFIHGKCIICHSICLMVAYVGLFINYLSLSPPGAAFCYLTGEFNYFWVAYFTNIQVSLLNFTGYVTYFAFMGLFFWLNVMCFDLYWSYRYIITFLKIWWEVLFNLNRFAAKETLEIQTRKKYSRCTLCTRGVARHCSHSDCF